MIYPVFFFFRPSFQTRSARKKTSCILFAFALYLFSSNDERSNKKKRQQQHNNTRQKFHLVGNSMQEIYVSVRDVRSTIALHIHFDEKYTLHNNAMELHCFECLVRYIAAVFLFFLLHNAHIN